MRHSILRAVHKPTGGGQAAALAVEMIRARPNHDRFIYLDDPALHLLSELSPISWQDILKISAKDRWTLLAVFTDPWGDDETSDAVTLCGECGNVVFHAREKVLS